MQSIAPTPRGDMGLIGMDVPRREDPLLVMGAGDYVADLEAPGRLDAAFVRSYASHGYLRSIETAAAAAVPGVAGVFTAADLPDLPPVPWPPTAAAPKAMEWPALARDKVRYVGEPIAVTLAGDRYTAEDAAELVLFEVDSLDPVLDPTAAAGDDSVRLFDGISNIAAVRTYGDPVDDVLAEAPVVLERRFRNGRIAPVSMEARAILAEPTPEGGLVVHCSHQAPQRLLKALTRSFGASIGPMRIVVPNVGGAFGAKSQTFPEYLVVCRLAVLTGRPVRWIEDRREAFQAATHGRGQSQTVRMAADEAGRVVALEVGIDADVGAYPHMGEFIPSMTGWVMSGPYRIPRIHVTVRSVLTTNTPTAAYRGAGRPEAAYALERMMDVLAARLGLDSAEVRRRNYITNEAFPYQSPTGALYDSGDYGGALQKALHLAGYESLRAEQQRRRSSGDGPRLGIGVASYVERSGGQSGTNEIGSIEITQEGQVIARSGTSPQGQGNTTALEQIVAHALDLPLDRVRVLQGDTKEVPEGTGTFGSRSVQVGGGALYEAAGEVLTRARTAAANTLEVAEADLEYASGQFRIRGTQRTVGLDEIARNEKLFAESSFAPPQAFPFGSYVAAVEVDEDTGRVTIVKFVAVDDCGIMVNPGLVQGQIVGSIAQGIGQALYERVVYDEYGQPLASSLMDYSLPTIAEIPWIDVGESVTPNPNVPLGTKGAGETGCIGAPPAVMNAIHDALQTDAEIPMPATPERVWRVAQGLDPN